MTQAELARKADVSLRTIKGWETGGVRPSFETVSRLAAALDLTLEQLHAA